MLRLYSQKTFLPPVCKQSLYLPTQASNESVCFVSFVFMEMIYIPFICFLFQGWMPLKVVFSLPFLSSFSEVHFFSEIKVPPGSIFRLTQHDRLLLFYEEPSSVCDVKFCFFETIGNLTSRIETVTPTLTHSDAKLDWRGPSALLCGFHLIKFR